MASPNAATSPARNAKPQYQPHSHPNIWAIPLRNCDKHPPNNATMSSAADSAVRHQAVVPDKLPTGEYPVSQLLVCNRRPLLIAHSSSTMTRMSLSLRSLRSPSLSAPHKFETGALILAQKPHFPRNSVRAPVGLGVRRGPRSPKPGSDAVLGKDVTVDGGQGRICAHHAAQRRRWCDWLLHVCLLEVMQ